MTVMNLKKTILNITIATALGVTASMAINPLNMDEDTITRGKIIVDVVNAADINPAETVGKMGTLWNGLKGTGSGLWGFGKAYKTAVTNTYSLYGNVAKTIAGAAMTGAGAVTGYDALRDMGTDAMVSATSSMKATVATIPGNARDLLKTGIETGKAGYAVYKVGKELEKDYEVIKNTAALVTVIGTTAAAA